MCGEVIMIIVHLEHTYWWGWCCLPGDESTQLEFVVPRDPAGHLAALSCSSKENRRY